MNSAQVATVGAFQGTSALTISGCTFEGNVAELRHANIAVGYLGWPDGILLNDYDPSTWPGYDK